MGEESPDTPMGASSWRQVAGNARLWWARNGLLHEMRAETSRSKVTEFPGLLGNSPYGNVGGETAKFLPVCKAALSWAVYVNYYVQCPGQRAA